MLFFYKTFHFPTCHNSKLAIYLCIDLFSAHFLSSLGLLKGRGNACLPRSLLASQHPVEGLNKKGAQ